MDNPCYCVVDKKKGLSAEGVVPSPRTHTSAPSPNSATGSKKHGFLDFPKKKVGQFFGNTPTSWSKNRCENPHGMHFICKHGHSIYRTVRCHARFMTDCPSCAKRWRRKIINEYTQRINAMEYPALVSLTLRKPMRQHKLTDLNALTQRCRKYLLRENEKREKKRKKTLLKKLKKTLSITQRRKIKNQLNKKLIPYEIRGFVSCLAPPNHIHCVWDCSFIHQSVIKKVWNRVTKDSYIVDIRKVRRGCKEHAVYYITKYITKLYRHGASVDLHGVHVVNSWGKRGGSVKRIRMVCRKCGTYFEFLWFAGHVEDYENDPVDFVEVDNDYG